MLCMLEERVTAKLRPIMPLDRPVPLCLPETRPYMSTHEEEERSSLKTNNNRIRGQRKTCSFFVA